MNRSARHLEDWLTELGTARSAGVLKQSGVARSFPWQAESKPAAVATTARRTSWYRGVRGVAMAAAIGLALVGIWKLESFLTPARTQNQPNMIASRAAKNANEITGGDTTVVKASKSDGKVDGEDIQAFVNQAASGKGGLRDASALAAKLILEQ